MAARPAPRPPGPLPRPWRVVLTAVPRRDAAQRLGVAYMLLARAAQARPAAGDATPGRAGRSNPDPDVRR